MKYILCLVYFLSFAVQAESLVFNTTGLSPLNRPGGDGFMDKVTEKALAKIGYQLETVKLPAERGLKNVNQGIDDAEMSRIAGLNRIYKNLRQVPEKIMDWEFVVFTKKKRDLSSGWESLAGQNVAFINGWKILEKNIPASAKINKVNTDRQLFLLLVKNRTDFVIYEKWAGLEVIRKNNYKDIKMLGPPLAVREMFIYLNKKHEDLIKPLSASLKSLKSEGTYKALEQSILFNHQN